MSNSCEITVNEVSNIAELENLLDQLSSDTLVWTNAYYIDTENGGIEWLNRFVESRGFALFGSGAKVLEILLKKDVCQTKLNMHNIPVPSFDILSKNNADRVDAFFANCKIDFPLVLKPTAECLSFGICLVHNYKEAVEKGRAILSDYPASDLIVEEFLPNNDITCGYLELGNDILLMPNHFEYTNKPGEKHIYDNNERLIIDNPNRQRKIVTEPDLRAQLETMIPRIVDVLGVRDITRIDGRQDKNGKLRYFDINGFPGLSGIGFISGMITLTFLFYPNYPQAEVYQALINTALANALIRNKLPVPDVLNTNNLFTLKSDLVIRTKKTCYNEV